MDTSNIQNFSPTSSTSELLYDCSVCGYPDKPWEVLETSRSELRESALGCWFCSVIYNGVVHFLGRDSASHIATQKDQAQWISLYSNGEHKPLKLLIDTDLEKEFGGSDWETLYFFPAKGESYLKDCLVH